MHVVNNTDSGLSNQSEITLDGAKAALSMRCRVTVVRVPLSVINSGEESPLLLNSLDRPRWTLPEEIMYSELAKVHK